MYYSSDIDFFSIHAIAYPQKSCKRIYSGFNPVTPLAFRPTKLLKRGSNTGALL